MQLSRSKTIVKNTFYLYLRMALTLLVSLYTVRAVINILGVEDYGLYNAIGGIVTSLSFLSAVLANASQRYFAIEIGKEEKGNVNKYFNVFFYAYLIISVIIVVCVEIVGIYLLNHKMIIPEGRLVASNFVLQFSLFSFIVSLLGSPFFALIIAYERMNIYAIVSILESFFKLGAVFLLLKSPIDQLAYYSILLLAITLISNFFYFIYACKVFKIRIGYSIDKSLIKDLFSYSGWTLFGTISGVASSQGVNVVLNIFSGPIANAAFSISNQISTVIQMFASSFFTAVRPPLTKSYSAKEYSYMQVLFNFSNKAIFVLTSAIVFPLLVKTEFVLKLWLGVVSPYMVDFVRIMLVYAMLISLSNPITTIVQAAGKVKLYHSIVDGFALLVLPLIILCLKLGFDIRYSLASLVIIFGIAHILRLYILRKVISFSIKEYILRFVFPALLVIFLSYILCGLLSLWQENSIFSNIVTIFLAALSVLFLSFLLLLNGEERHFVFNFLKKR